MFGPLGESPDYRYSSFYKPYNHIFRVLETVIIIMEE